MKKTICIFCIFLAFFSVDVSASTLGEALKMVMERLEIEASDDTSYADTLQNRLKITEKSVISTAIKNKLLISKNNVINLDGTDFTPLINGIVYRTAADDRYKIITGTLYTLEKVNHVVFSDETVYVTPELSRDDLNRQDVYTCVVTSDNMAEYVWIASEFIQPSMYRAKLYWADDNIMIVTGLERKAFRFWIAENTVEYTEFDMTNVRVDKQFVLNNLDCTVYIFADYRNGKYITYGIGKE